MAEEPYRNFEIRDRIEAVNERVVKSEGRQEGHELVCAQRYAQIIQNLTELKTNQSTIAKIGLIIAAGLGAIELGRATVPNIIDLLKALH